MEQLDAVRSWREADVFDASQVLALELAEAMTETPPAVSDELFGRLRERFDPQQLVELAAAVAFENFRARFNRVFEVEPQGFYVRSE